MQNKTLIFSATGLHGWYHDKYTLDGKLTAPSHDPLCGCGSCCASDRSNCVCEGTGILIEWQPSGNVEHPCNVCS